MSDPNVWGVAIVNGSEVAHLRHGQRAFDGYRFADIRIPTTHASELPSVEDFAALRGHMTSDTYAMVTASVFAELLAAHERASKVTTCAKCGAKGETDGFIRHGKTCKGESDDSKP